MGSVFQKSIINPAPSSDSGELSLNKRFSPGHVPCGSQEAAAEAPGCPAACAQHSTQGECQQQEIPLTPRTSSAPAGPQTAPPLRPGERAQRKLRSHHGSRNRGRNDPLPRLPTASCRREVFERLMCCHRTELIPADPEAPPQGAGPQGEAAPGHSQGGKPSSCWRGCLPP